MTDNNGATGTSSAAGAPSRSEFDLQPDLAAWINRESDRIAGLVEDLTEMALGTRTIAPHPDLPIKAAFGPKDIIGEPISSITEAGKIIVRFYPDQNRFLGLSVRPKTF